MSHGSFWFPTAEKSRSAKSEFHFFVSEDDPSFQKHAEAWTHNTREKFFGARKQGAHAGSFRVQFTLPGRHHAPKAVDLVPLSTGESTFAAVKIRQPLGASINSFSPDYFLRVTEVIEG